MDEIQIIEILEKDTLIYTAALHWNVARCAYMDEPPRIIYVREFIDEIANRIFKTFDPSILTKRSVLHMAHWYTEHMIREQYALLVNKPTH